MPLLPTSARWPAARTRGSFGWIADLGAGALAGLIVVVLPPFVSLVLVGGLCALAVLTRLERVDHLAEVLTVLTALTMPMNRLLVGPVPVSDLLLVAAVGLFVLIRLTERERSPNPGTYRPIVIGLTILAIGGLVGAVFEAPGPFMYKALGEPIRDVSGWGQNVGNLAKFVLGSFIPIGLWMLARPGRELMRRIAGAFVVGCCISVLLGLAVPTFRFGNRIGGLTVHPGQFGSLSLLGMGTALALLLSRRPFRSWGYGVLPLLAIGVIGSGSRAALGGMVVLACIIGPFTRRRAVIGAVMAGAAIVILMFATGLVRPEGDDALGRALGGEESAQGSNTIREDLGRQVWDRFTQRPLTGNGYNYMRPSHNVYLGVIASAGVLGVIGLGLIVTTIVRRTWRRRSDMMAVCITAGYVGYLAAAYFDNIFWWRWLWFYVGMVVAVVASSPATDDLDPDDIDDLDDRRAVRPAARPADARVSV